VPKVAHSVRDDHVLVIEYYEAPSAKFPEGRLITAAGSKLINCRALPYEVGADGGPALPFTRQTAVTAPGSFWGISILERAIPVQRAYNAVKNRKHEFLNRLAMGVLAVEDGSLDTENLGEEGLSPGKVLIYRQGATPPRFLEPGNIPNDFSAEEDKLLAEFIYISGVSEFMRNSAVPSGLTSGVALQMLIEQDDTRLAISAESIRNAIRGEAQHILRMYKQFASLPRVSRVIGGDGAVELLCWKRSDITSDDISFISENELSETPAQKRSFILDLLKAGLLHDEDGKISNRTRVKILEMLGFGMWENSQDIDTLQIKKSIEENMELAASKTAPEVRDIDDHDIHIAEHTKFMLGGDYARFVVSNPGYKDSLAAHIKEHRLYRSLTQEAAKNMQGGQANE
jgi:hypothetical protein